MNITYTPKTCFVVNIDMHLYISGFIAPNSHKKSSHVARPYTQKTSSSSSSRSRQKKNIKRLHTEVVIFSYCKDIDLPNSKFSGSNSDKKCSHIARPYTQKTSSSSSSSRSPNKKIFCRHTKVVLFSYRSDIDLPNSKISGPNSYKKCSHVARQYTQKSSSSSSSSRGSAK